jgi:hypothetical protein
VSDEVNNKKKEKLEQDIFSPNGKNPKRTKTQVQNHTLAQPPDQVELVSRVIVSLPEPRKSKELIVA